MFLAFASFAERLEHCVGRASTRGLQRVLVTPGDAIDVVALVPFFVFSHRL